MTVISYAQNFEDVMLWRALQHVGTGYYVDIGANAGTDGALFDHRQRRGKCTGTQQDSEIVGTFDGKVT